LFPDQLVAFSEAGPDAARERSGKTGHRPAQGRETLRIIPSRERRAGSETPMLKAPGAFSMCRPGDSGDAG
jgi:hypothetical protein